MAGLRRAAGWLAGGLSRLWTRGQTRPAGTKSLRLRLSLFFTVFLAGAWLCTAFFAWLECRAAINEFFDTQQMLLAERLAETDFADGAVRPPKISQKDRDDLEDDALGFAVFNPAGDIVMADAEHGRYFAFEPERPGFSNEPLAGDEDEADETWRIVRLAARDGRHSVAVGQEAEYRQDLALEMLGRQLIPWLLLPLALLLGLIFFLSRELAPLRALARQLRARTPLDAAPLSTDRVPSEVLPLAEALNGFFAKTNALFLRERAFISDAAHELRTPLAGLRVQAQVAAQEGLAEESRNEALGFLQEGIDRCARLVEQLLALSRLEAASPEAPPAGLAHGRVDWPALLAELLTEYRPKADLRGLTLDAGGPPPPVSTPGYPALAALLLRNLLDNAVAYAPRGGRVRLALEHNRLTIENSAPTLPPSQAARLGERFFRPPGQEAPGSGLGLSIVRRIAEIHRFGLTIQPQEHAPGSPETLFRVVLAFPA